MLGQHTLKTTENLANNSTKILALKDWKKIAIGNLFSMQSKEDQANIVKNALVVITSSRQEFEYFSKTTPFLPPIFLKQVMQQMDGSYKDKLTYYVYHLFEDVLHEDWARCELRARLKDLCIGEKIFEYQNLTENLAVKKFGGSLGLEKYHRGVYEASFPVILPFSESERNNKIHDEDITTLKATTSYFGIYGKLSHHSKKATTNLSFSEFQQITMANCYGDPKTITTSLLEKINTKDKLLFLLKTLLDNEEEIKKIANRSFWHELGKLRVPLILAEDLSVTLHLWEMSPQFNANDEFMHDHHAHFASFVALGEVEHFIYKSRAATENEIELYNKFISKLKLMDAQVAELILYSIRGIHESNMDHPIYDSIVLHEVCQLSKNDQERKSVKELLLTKEQIAIQLGMFENEIETIARLGIFSLTSFDEEFKRNKGLLFLQPPVVDHLKSGDSYYLSANLIHKFIANTSRTPTATLVIRKGRINNAFLLERIAREEYGTITGKKISGGKEKRRYINNKDELVTCLSNLIHHLENANNHQSKLSSKIISNNNEIISCDEENITTKEGSPETGIQNRNIERRYPASDHKVSTSRPSFWSRIIPVQPTFFNTEALHTQNNHSVPETARPNFGKN